MKFPIHVSENWNFCHGILSYKSKWYRGQAHGSDIKKREVVGTKYVLLFRAKLFLEFQIHGNKAQTEKPPCPIMVQPYSASSPRTLLRKEKKSGEKQQEKATENRQAINGVQPLNEHHKNTWYTLISISGLLQLILVS